MGINLEKNE